MGKKNSSVKKGDNILVYWEGDHKWYSGEVISADNGTGECHVVYDDGDQEHLNLNNVRFRVFAKKTPLISSIADSLLDIEDRLPTTSVLTTRLQWWEKWRNKVSDSVKTNNIKEVANAMLQLSSQLKKDVTTTWWQFNQAEWKQQLKSAESVSDIEDLLKQLKRQSVDWSVVKGLFGDIDTSTAQEQKGEGSVAVKNRKKRDKGSVSVGQKQESEHLLAVQISNEGKDLQGNTNLVPGNTQQKSETGVSLAKRQSRKQKDEKPIEDVRKEYNGPQTRKRKSDSTSRQKDTSYGNCLLSSVTKSRQKSKLETGRMDEDNRKQNLSNSLKEEVQEPCNARIEETNACLDLGEKSLNCKTGLISTSKETHQEDDNSNPDVKLEMENTVAAEIIGLAANRNSIVAVKNENKNEVKVEDCQKPNDTAKSSKATEKSGDVTQEIKKESREDRVPVSGLSDSVTNGSTKNSFSAKNENKKEVETSNFEIKNTNKKVGKFGKCQNINEKVCSLRTIYAKKIKQEIKDDVIEKKLPVKGISDGANVSVKQCKGTLLENDATYIKTVDTQINKMVNAKEIELFNNNNDSSPCYLRSDNTFVPEDSAVLVDRELDREKSHIYHEKKHKESVAQDRAQGPLGSSLLPQKISNLVNEGSRNSKNKSYDVVTESHASFNKSPSTKMSCSRDAECSAVNLIENESHMEKIRENEVLHRISKSRDVRDHKGLENAIYVSSSEHSCGRFTERKNVSSKVNKMKNKNVGNSKKRNKESWRVNVLDGSMTLRFTRHIKNKRSHSPALKENTSFPGFEVHGKSTRNGLGIKKRRKCLLKESDKLADDKTNVQQNTSCVSNQVCTVCKFEGAERFLLLCDGQGCCHAFHTFCLKPPLLEIPDGDWLCPFCDKSSLYFEMLRKPGNQYPNKKIEKVIGRRKVQDGTGVHGAKIEYLIKWISLSHHYDCWVPEDWIFHQDRPRLQLFNRKLISTTEIPDFIDERNPEWLNIDRVIACRQKDGVECGEGVSGHESFAGPINNGTYEFLVKWMRLDYCDTTWEDNLTEELLGSIDKLVERHRRANVQVQSGEVQHIGLSLNVQPAYLVGGVLHGYQLHGLKWIVHNFENRNNVILADEMGLGKTIQAIGFVTCMKNEKLSRKPVLVIGPKSTLPGWEQEFRQWAPDLNFVVYQGDKNSRSCIRKHEFYTSSKNILFDVLITSYELAVLDNSVLQKFEWASIIVDEGHRIKNARSKLGMFLKRLTTDFRLLLTGTPLQNNLTELFSLLHFLDPSKVPDPEIAACEFSEIGRNSKGQDDNKSSDSISRLHELLRPRMLRRLKSEVLHEMLPGKKVVEVPCALTDKQRQLYIGLLKRDHKFLNKGVQSGHKRTLNFLLMDLKLCCNHPYLFPGQEPNENGQTAFKALVESSGKLQFLEKILPKLKKGGHRVLLFSQMRKMLNILEDFLCFLGYSYCRMDGSTSASDRQQNIKKFSSSDDIFIFLISTRAGGLGLNLANADTVIIYDPDFNPFVDIQAQSRVHRIGQENPVLVYQLITKSSVEEKIMQRSRKKIALGNIVMNSSGTESLNELQMILQHGVRKIMDDKNPEYRLINYTDEDIEIFLNRDLDASNNDASALHGYLGSIHSNIMDQAEEPKLASDKVWDQILGPLIESTELEELGRGKRQRGDVRYACDASDDDDEYSPSSSGGECSSSSSEYSAEDFTNKFQKLNKKQPGNYQNQFEGTFATGTEAIKTDESEVTSLARTSNATIRNYQRDSGPMYGKFPPFQGRQYPFNLDIKPTPISRIERVPIISMENNQRAKSLEHTSSKSQNNASSKSQNNFASHPLYHSKQ